MLTGTVTSVAFLGVHYEIIVDIGGFKWMIQTTDEHFVGDKVGLYIEPDAIHIMKNQSIRDFTAIIPLTVRKLTTSPMLSRRNSREQNPSATS